LPQILYEFKAKGLAHPPFDVNPIARCRIGENEQSFSLRSGLDIVRERVERLLGAYAPGCAVRHYRPPSVMNGRKRKLLTELLQHRVRRILFVREDDLLKLHVD
jgi:hypothetical protein